MKHRGEQLHCSNLPLCSCRVEHQKPNYSAACSEVMSDRVWMWLGVKDTVRREFCSISACAPQNGQWWVTLCWGRLLTLIPEERWLQTFKSNPSLHHEGNLSLSPTPVP